MDAIIAFQEMQDVLEAIEDVADVLDGYDVALPKAEYDYQTKKREVTERLRGQEPATTLRDTVRGIPEVAELRRVRDELNYKRQTARQEHTRLMGKMYVLRDQINREWNRPSNMA
jgi:hypothetical protein